MRVVLSLRWGYLFTLIIQSYLDISVGSMLSSEQAELKTPSDIFDFGFTLVCMLGIFVFPILNFIFLHRNVDQLDKKEFKDKFGSLYNGCVTHSATKRQGVIKMSNWFLFRRFITAVNLVYVRNLTIWFQLSLSVCLCLADVCIKLYLSPYASTIAGFINFFNDTIVLILSYFMFVFTDLTPSQEDKYLIGWVYNGLVGLLVVSNLFLILYCGIKDVVKKIKAKQALKNAINERK